jgi:acyl carrier protein
MNADDIIARMSKVICSELNIAPVALRAETTFLELEGWDSLSCTTIMLALEKDFQIRIPFLRARALQNMGGLAELILATLKEA